MIYLYLAFYLLLLTIAYVNSIEQKIKTTIFYLAAVPVVFLFAFRDVTVGGDTMRYVEEFLLSDYEGREIGYVLFVELIGLFGKTPFVYVFFTSLISVVPFVFLVKEQSKSNPMSLLYLFCFHVLIVCIETNIRQNVGTGLMMLSYIAYDRVKLKKKSLLVLPISLLIWGTLSHSSLYFMAPLCLCIYFVRFSKRVSIALIFLSFIVGSITNKYLINVFEMFYVYTEGVEGLMRLNNYSISTNLGYFSQAAFSIARFLYLFWALLVLYSTSDKDWNNFFIKCLVVYTVIFNFASSSDLMYRAAYTLQILSIVYVPSKLMKTNRFAILCLFLVIWFRGLFLLCTVPSMQNPAACMFPYKFIF